MNVPSLEEMAFIVHSKDHKKFEEVSKRISATLGQKQILYYEWCPRCKEIMEENKL
jgi:hypothetical protein